MDDSDSEMNKANNEVLDMMKEYKLIYFIFDYDAQLPIELREPGAQGGASQLHLQG